MPSIDDYTRGPAHELLEFAGDDVTLVTQMVVDHDPDHGTPIYDDVEVETKAEVVVRGTPQFDRRIDGIDSSVVAVAWVADTIDEIYTGSESDVDGPTLVETETHSYVVHNWFDEGNGKLRLHLDDS